MSGPSELRARLWVGTTLALLAAAALLLDDSLGPWFPCLLVLVLVLGLASARELHDLLAAGPRPGLWLCLLAVALVLLANWPAHVGLWGKLAPAEAEARAWRDVHGAFAAVVVLAFLVEMGTFREPGGVVPRMALLVWLTAYLGLLPSFLAQLRWGEGGVPALALTIFVPKVGDIGAYFTGRLLGRHPMTPRLSPKKTWEGLAGGLLAAALTAVLLNRALAPALLGGDAEAAGFGLAVGLAGVLGDLAESLVKRDGGRKDASQVLPGFGGVLDVVDAVVFAAPVAYWWLR
jgi:phosphatidate cytidylyltransferase